MSNLFEIDNQEENQFSGQAPEQNQDVYEEFWSDETQSSDEFSYDTNEEQREGTDGADTLTQETPDYTVNVPSANTAATALNKALETLKGMGLKDEQAIALLEAVRHTTRAEVDTEAQIELSVRRIGIPQTEWVKVGQVMRQQLAQVPPEARTNPITIQAAYFLSVANPNATLQENLLSMLERLGTQTPRMAPMAPMPSPTPTGTLLANRTTPTILHPTPQKPQTGPGRRKALGVSFLAKRFGLDEESAKDLQKELTYVTPKGY